MNKLKSVSWTTRNCLTLFLTFLAIDSACAQEVIWQLGKGSGLWDVGIQPRGEDTPAEGPDAIVAGSDSRVYVLDQLNRRVLAFNLKTPKETPQSVSIPDGIEATDLAFVAGNIYLWADKPVQLLVQKAGQNTVQPLSHEVSQAESVNIESRFAQMGSATASQGQSAQQIQPLSSAEEGFTRIERMETTSRKQLVVQYQFSNDRTGASISLRRDGRDANTIKLGMRARDRFGAVELLDADESGRSFVLTENVPLAGPRHASATLVRFGPAGAIDGIYPLPFGKGVTIPRRPVTVTANGDVLFLNVTEAGASIWRLQSQARPTDGLIGDIGNPTTPQTFDSIGQSLATGRQRSDIVAAALDFSTASYVASPSAYGNDPDRQCIGFSPTRVRRPWFLDGHRNQEVIGVPYEWGGKRSLTQFRSDLTAGRLAGNVCTRESPTRAATTGIDCSGLVSEVWGLSNHETTRTLASVSTPLAHIADLLPGDILLFPGEHVILLLRWRPDGRMETIEAATGRCQGRVCSRIEFVSTFEGHGYQPRRFKDVQ